MARRSIVRRDPRVPGDPELSAYPDPGEAETLAARGSGGPRRGRWAGGGGRWLVWAGRAVLWALIIVIVFNGVRAPFERFTQGGSSSGQVAPSAGTGFPTDRAASFANQFAAAYLNMNGAQPQERAGRLAPFLPEGTSDGQFGWDGAGQMSAGAIQPYGVDVTDAQHAKVNLIFQSGNRRMLLSVPVFYSDGRFVVSERPAVLPAPAKADLPHAAEPDRDETTAGELRQQLGAFFEAYAKGDTVALQRYVSGTKLESFGGAFTFVKLQDLVVPPGGTIRDITVVVVWGLVPAAPPAAEPTSTGGTQGSGTLTQSYRLTVEKQGERWYVKDIRGADRSVG
ncbi:conjugal transfer protein [Spongiactinospora gelatinilytica]|uniref:Conjugal transfer protein n=1 Tax=Spongiactinospora gelatinilytica TaxID=2666298 RepID=A0A2W2GUT6_9ACTN|nr:conjugal transfer protein [Spongiactinospora gelatinilytica]PZG51443.1 conjugal transfer protein [Spongiactinospora gelatinilytica]